MAVNDFVVIVVAVVVTRETYDCMSMSTRERRVRSTHTKQLAYVSLFRLISLLLLLCITLRGGVYLPKTSLRPRVHRLNAFKRSSHRRKTNRIYNLKREIIIRVGGVL